MPVLRRPALQEAGDALRQPSRPRRPRPPVHPHDVGSTGRPVQTVGTALTQLFWSALTVRDHLWHGRDFSRKLAVIRQFTLAQAPPEHGSWPRNWGSATDGTFRTGPAAALDIDRDGAGAGGAGWPASNPATS